MSRRKATESEQKILFSNKLDRRESHNRTINDSPLCFANTNTTYNLILNESPHQRAKLWVSIITLPKEISHCLKALKDVKSLKVLESILKKKDTIKGINLIQDFISTFCQPHLSSKYGIGCNSPNQKTVTVGKDNLRVGLHVDNHLKFPRSRILINLGSESRYFLFINLSIKQLYDLVSKHNNVLKPTLGSSGLGTMFMKLFPSYPVIKLKVSPGEAYLAPTEHIIHDGSTEGTNNLDIFFTVRSIFNLNLTDYHSKSK